MSSGKFVFRHLLEFLPIYEFNKCVTKYNDNHRVHSFSCYDQYICMAFAQLSNRESLRDIEICLRSVSSKLYHIGLRSNVSKSTLSDANERRDCRIYQEFVRILTERAQELYVDEPFAIDISNSLYALDSSMIELCMSLFPWAKYRPGESAIKLHTLLDLRGNIPDFIIITDGKGSDVAFMDKIYWQAGAIYLMDRGYLDFVRLYKITTSGAFFVIRLRNRIGCKRIYSRESNKI